MVYLDYNATTPIAPEVASAMRPFLSEGWGNPSSEHALGRTARAAVDAARVQVAAMIGAASGEILFSSGGTEASNTVIKGLAGKRGGAGHIITSVVEHPATLEPCRFLERAGWRVTRVPVDGAGMIDPDEIRRAIAPDTVLVSIMHAQNEVGTLEPIAEIGRMTRERGVLFHVDAAQSLGKLPFDVSEMQVDFVSLAGHKLYAPKGVGALFIRAGLTLEPLMHGAGHESGRRAGTENTLLIVGLAAACELAVNFMRSGGPARVQAMRDRLYAGLSGVFGERMVLNGHETSRLPNTLNVSLLGRIGADILARAPDLCASTGSACHAGEHRPSPVLSAMGLSAERALGAIRLSVGRDTSESDVDTAIAILKRACETQ